MSNKVLVFFSFFFLSNFFAFVFLVPTVNAEAPLPEEALVDLIKPSIVRIASHTTGNARIPFIDVDFVKKTIKLLPETYSNVPIDEYLVGSGFIVHPDGYIATNAHVVSQQALKYMLASERVMSTLYAKALFLSDAEIDTFLQSETDHFMKEILQFVIEKSQFDLTTERVVLRPDSRERSLTELFLKGFPAEIISVNDNFFQDEQDVALIRIAQSHLPSLNLGESNSLAVGKKTFIFGFPATAELNQNSALEATFTQGVVSALKESENKNFRLFQTDAKVSKGSSGGPLFDAKGSVVGIVTLQTNALDQDQGDNFAFALPIEIMKDVMIKNNILPTEGAYGTYMRNALDTFSLRQCDKTTEFLEQALEKSNTSFVQKGIFEKYKNQCNEWKKTGKSVDTQLDMFQEKFRSLGDSALYFLGIGLFLFSVFGSILFWMLRQIAREEKEIVSLEKRLYTDEYLIKKYEQSLTEKSKKNEE